jgi:hypothetical protein
MFSVRLEGSMQITVEVPLTSCLFRQGVNLSELTVWVVREVVIPDNHHEL